MSRKGKQPTVLPTSYPAPIEDSQIAGQNTIFKLVANMHLNSEYSDLTILCKGRRFAAHKIVVCQRSEHLSRLCKNYQDPSKPLVINRDPILIEKVLEFLYKADYTVPNYLPTPEPTREKSEVRKHIDRARKQTKKNFIESVEQQTDQEIETNESEHIGGELVNIQPSSKENNKETTEENILGDNDAFLLDGHSCYFHARMYGEGDSFMIKDLKASSKAYFIKAFNDSPDEESFKRTIEEIYSDRANYIELRAEAIKLVADNMKHFWEGRDGSDPVLTRQLMKSVPDFTSELLPVMLDMCVITNVYPSMTAHKPHPGENTRNNLRVGHGPLRRG